MIKICLFLTHSLSEYPFWISRGKKWQSKQVTVHNSFIEPWKASETLFIRLIKKEILRIALYTNRCNWLYFTFAFVSWFLPDRNVGTFSSTFKALRSSTIVNPLSAIHELSSVQIRESNIPLLTPLLAAVSLSDMEPP